MPSEIVQSIKEGCSQVILNSATEARGKSTKKSISPMKKGILQTIEDRVNDKSLMTKTRNVNINNTELSSFMSRMNSSDHVEVDEKN